MKRAKRHPAGSIVHDNIRLHVVPCRLANACCFPLRWKITRSVVRHLPRPFSSTPPPIGPIDIHAYRSPSVARPVKIPPPSFLDAGVTDTRRDSYGQS